jgi:hypothetical protein
MASEERSLSQHEQEIFAALEASLSTVSSNGNKHIARRRRRSTQLAVCSAVAALATIGLLSVSYVASFLAFVTLTFCLEAGWRLWALYAITKLNTAMAERGPHVPGTYTTLRRRGTGSE